MARRAGQAAEEEAIAAVYRQHSAALRSFVTHLTGDEELAKDIVEETVLRAWRNLGSFGPGGEVPRPWLFTVARNLVIDEQRRRKSRPESSGTGPDGRGPGGDGLGQGSAPAGQPVAVDETAALLHIPAGTVKSRTYYALRSLRLALEEMGFLS
ncbi:MAG: sigma-70 family RNA polymerase sigma factor [Acidimicrobiales bacterium]